MKQAALHASLRSLSALLIPSVLFLLTACTISAPREAVIPSTSDEAETALDASEAIMHTRTGSTLEERMLPSGMLEIGHPNAPVAFTLFTNHSCTYCHTFDRLLTDRILTEFVENGSVRMTIVPVPLQAYPTSTRHTALLSCALQQGKGWPMHRALFHGEPTNEQLTLMDIDTDALDTCLTTVGSGTLLPASNVTLVPSYTINETPYTGLPEWSELRGQINAAGSL